MRRWTMRGDISTSNATGAAASFTAAILCRRGNSHQHECQEYSERDFHWDLLNMNLKAG
jgi:hypothetical protein